MRNFVKQNPWFIAGLGLTILLGMVLVYELGFWKTVMAISPLPERLRDVSFPIWDQHSLSEHGFLVFLSSKDFAEEVAYSNHSLAYLLFMYAFYKIEMYIPQLPMRAVVPTLEMLFCVVSVVYVAISSLKERIKLNQGALILLAILFFITMPGFWISAGKFNVDNPFHFLFPILLLTAHRLSKGDLSGAKLWLPLGALCITAPIAGALLGMYLMVSSIKNDGLSKNMLELGGRVILVSVIVYLQPVITSHILGFTSSNSGWKFRSGLDGDVSYFTNVFNSVINPYYPRPTYLLALPAVLLSAQLAYIAIRNRAIGESAQSTIQGDNPGLFYGVVFSQYVITSLLWPQAVSIHPYLYDYLLVAPISVWIVLNFARHDINPRIWIWVMLFFISFNLQQIAQSQRMADHGYPSWAR